MVRLCPTVGDRGVITCKCIELSLFLGFEVISYSVLCQASLVCLFYINNIIFDFDSVNILHIFICKIVLKWKVVKYAALAKNNGSDIWNSERIVLSLGIAVMIDLHLIVNDVEPNFYGHEKRNRNFRSVGRMRRSCSDLSTAPE